MDFILNKPVVYSKYSTGHKIRELRNSLNISAQKLSDLSGVSKGNILKAERCEMHLNQEHFIKICDALCTTENELIDIEHKVFYDGYDKYIDKIVNVIGTKETCNYLNIDKYTLNKWRYNGVNPSFKHRKSIIDLLYKHTPTIINNFTIL